MSIREPEQNCVSSGDGGGFFITSDSEGDWAEDRDREDHRDSSRLTGALGGLFMPSDRDSDRDRDSSRLTGALGGLFMPSDTDRDSDRDRDSRRLTGALGGLFRAVRCEFEPVRPEHISTLVGIIVHSFRQKDRCVTHREQDGELDCPGCSRFMAEPVTAACGHSYCRSCLQQTSLSKCKTCREELGDKHVLRVNVLLCGLLHKWFPDEVQKSRRMCEVQELLRSKQLTQAATLASQLLQS
ncbi:LON peptidase N-terminal domain and ring finger 1, like isoform X1, partial [Tachysurus ichikawai]